VGQYLYNLGLAIDQLLNTILLGDPDEGLSGRLGRAYLSGKPKFWVKPLMRVNDWLWLVLTGESDHSVNAVEPEELHEKELWRWYYED
jgi:hypothetical protein